MKNIRVKVRRHVCLNEYDYAIYDGKKALFAIIGDKSWWKTEEAAVRNAKAMAKRIGAKYDPEIIKQHGC